MGRKKVNMENNHGQYNSKSIGNWEWLDQGFGMISGKK